jgi:hypothetical protein
VISELEKRIIDIIEFEEGKDKRIKKSEQSIRETTQSRTMYI